MTDQYQPTGVTATIDASQVPDSGFIALEVKDGNYITLPSHIVITNAGSNTPCVLNAAILRTPNDTITIEVTDGSVDLYILKTPVTKFAEINSETAIAKHILSAEGKYEFKNKNGVPVMHNAFGTAYTIGELSPPAPASASTSTGTPSQGSDETRIFGD